MIWKIFIAVLALTVAAQLFVESHPHFPPERLFAWNALYGFLACAVLILLAKALGLLLKRRDDYYGD
jgi:putative Ca2+/H+ antiporter (TMEM165/GDT1 family)